MKLIRKWARSPRLRASNKTLRGLRKACRGAGQGASDVVWSFHTRSEQRRHVPRQALPFGSSLAHALAVLHALDVPTYALRRAPCQHARQGRRRPHRVLLEALSAIGICAVAVFGTSIAFAAPTYKGQPYQPGELIVLYKDAQQEDLSTLRQGSAPAWLEALGAREVRRFPSAARVHARVAERLRDLRLNRTQGPRWEELRERMQRWRHVKLQPGMSIEAAMERFAADPSVEYVEPNYLVQATALPNDPGFQYLWALKNTGQSGGTAGADIRAERAWDQTRGGADTVIAVIDSGVDWRHADLSENVWRNVAEVDRNRADDDANGYTDDLFGWDFYDNDNDPADANGHGTHVAGTIAATGNNGVGVTGVAWHARVMPLRTLGPQGQGSTTAAVSAIYYAVDNGAQIINASWGGPGRSRALEDAIAYAERSGVLFVAAAGNAGADNDRTAQYPSSYPQSNVLAVAAADNRDALANFSNYGASSVDLAAPGVNILSTTPGNGYGWMSGTSMAAPVVSGVAALLVAQDPTRSATELKTILMDSVDPRAALATRTRSGGRVNAEKALAYAEPALPNLRIDSAWIGATAVRAGQPVTLNARVQNTSTTTSGQTVRVTYYVDGQKIDEAEQPALAGNGSSTFAVSWIPVAAGIYRWTAVVDDANRIVESDEGDNGFSSELVVEAATANVGPIADAGSGISIGYGQRGILDGTGSSDPDGRIVRWQWRQVDGPTVSTSALDQPQLTVQGRFLWSTRSATFELTVTDDAGESATARVAVELRGYSSG